MKIYLKMLKKWGECPEGSVQVFDESKGRRVIAAGCAVEVPEPKTQRRDLPRIETAMLTPSAETATTGPQRQGRRGDTRSPKPPETPKEPPKETEPKEGDE